MTKIIPKILTILFLAIFFFQLASLIVLLAIPQASQAIDLQVDIGDKENIEMTGTTALIAEYIKAVYKYALGIVGILATVVLMFGGILWITAGGSSERVANAKSWIIASLTGLALALSSYLILYTINPALVNFRISPVKKVEEKKSDEISEFGCCITKNNQGDIIGCIKDAPHELCNDDFGPDDYYANDNTCQAIEFLELQAEANGETFPDITCTGAF